MELQALFDGAQVSQLKSFVGGTPYWGKGFGNSILREYKPYITNGIKSEYCENFLSIESISSTVAKAFDFTTQRKPAGDDDDRLSMMSVLWLGSNYLKFKVFLS